MSKRKDDPGKLAAGLEGITQGTLFDMPATEKGDSAFRTMKDKYGAWPVTVWEIDHQDKAVREAELAIGDIGLVRAEAGKANLSYKTMGQSTRVGSFTKPTEDESVYRGKVTVSIFSPAVCQLILNMFGHKAPATGRVCYDPFAGGGTRAILAARHGYTYTGMEIREDEVAAVRARCEKNGVAAQVTIHHGDARTPPIEDSVADFILTCPPYYNLETYNGGGGDLSMLPSYTSFLDQLAKVVQECRRIAKPKATAAWVVGLHRTDAGWLLPLNHDITRLHKEAGWRLDEEIILYHKNTGSIQRVGMFEQGQQHLVRQHEYVLIFQGTG